MIKSIISICSNTIYLNICCVLLLLYSDLTVARDSGSLKLQRERKLGINFVECKKIENKIGQLFYINVDGYGEKQNSPYAISPAYISLVQDLQIGGVLPHTRNKEFTSIQSDFQKLQQVTDQPLLIGVDYLALSGLAEYLAHNGKQTNAAKADEGAASFGLGYGGGFIETYHKVSNECLKRIAFIDAFLHKAIGLNLALGPTVDQSIFDHSISEHFLKQKAASIAPIVQDVINQFDSLGVATTLKHFPYTPETYNLHKKTEDTLLPRDEVLRRIEIFKLLSNKTGFVMSTHLINSNIDPKDVATFSETWISLLRQYIGSNSILMTDGIFMFDSYSEKTKSYGLKWPYDQIKIKNDHSIFAARSILAGHDMVLLEGSSRETMDVFNDLLFIACQDKQVSKKLRERIDESYKRITTWKSQNQDQLRSKIEIPKTLLDEAQKLYPIAEDSCPDENAFNEFKTKVDNLNLQKYNFDNRGNNQNSNIQQRNNNSNAIH